METGYVYVNWVGGGVGGVVFFFNDTATTEIYTLSLHDALPISYTEVLDLSKGWISKVKRSMTSPT